MNWGGRGFPQFPEDASSEFYRVESGDSGQSTVVYVERQLRSNGVLKALHQAKWLT